MIKFSNNYVLKYFKEYPQDFIYQRSLFLFLMFIKFAQNKRNRIAYYTYCCFLSRQNNITHRTYATWVCRYLNIKSFHIEAKNFLLFRTKEDNIAFHALECDYRHSYIESFTSDYFYKENYDYSYLLKYSSFILKVEFTMYAILWQHVERIRQRKYNEYLKMHPRINYYKNWNVRTAYNQAPDTEYGVFFILTHVWIKEWLLQVRKQKYHIYFIKGRVKSDLLEKNQQSLIYNYYLKSVDYKLMKAVSEIELTNKTRLRTKFFRRSMTFRWCLETCHHLVAYANYYPDQIRFDIYYLWQPFYLCSLSAPTYFKRIQIDLATLENRLFSEFINKPKILHYFNLKAFMFYEKELLIYKNVRFSYKVFELLLCTGITCFPTLVKWNTVQWRLSVEILFENNWAQYERILQRFHKTLVFANYIKVDPALGNNYIARYYDYWRSFNTDMLYQWFDGRLSNYYVFLRYDLDSYLFNRDTWTWTKIYEHWIDNLFLYPIDLPKIFAPVNRRRPLTLRNIIARLKNPLKYKNSGIIVVPKSVRDMGWATINRTLPFIAYHTIKSLYIRTIKLSRKLAYVAFYCMFNVFDNLIYDYYGEKQGNNLQSLFQAQMIIRRILTNYKVMFNDFRRAVFGTNGTTIHGKDPSRLEDWKVHANWMRIISLLPHQLPYYYIKDDEWWNYVNDLWKKRKKDRLNMIDSNLYFIENE